MTLTELLSPAVTYVNMKEQNEVCSFCYKIFPCLLTFSSEETLQVFHLQATFLK